MKWTSKLDKIERERLALAMGGIQKEWGFHRSFDFNELLRKWERFVLEVENGYQMSIYDYLHDLAMRDVIEEVKSQMPSELQVKITEAMHALDERFKVATVRVSKPIDFDREGDANEWWFRIPRFSGPDLQREFMAEGLTPER